MDCENEIATKEEMLAEAKKIGSMLGLPSHILDELDNGVVYYSERQNKMFPAVLYWLSNNPDFMKKKEELEEDGNFVFHAILTHLYDGDMLDLLFVSKYKDDWELAEEDARSKVAFSKCHSPYADEMGSILVKPVMGGLMREA